MSNRKSVLILTGYDDQQDAGYKEVSDITMPSKVRYCEKHGYDFLCLRSLPKLRGIDELGKRRLLMCFEMLKNWDFVFWVDADAVITNPDIQVEEIVSNSNHEECFFVSPDYFTGALPDRYVNTGNFLLRKTNTSDGFEKAFMQLQQNFIQEQQGINYFLRIPNLRRQIAVVENKYLGSHPMIVCERRVTVHNVGIDNPRPWNSSDLIAHLAGLPNKDRLDILNSHFRNYL